MKEILGKVRLKLEIEGGMARERKDERNIRKSKDKSRRRKRW
jgi:hypothetical protein